MADLLVPCVGCALPFTGLRIMMLCILFVINIYTMRNGQNKTMMQNHKLELPHPQKLHLLKKNLPNKPTATTSNQYP